MKMEVWHTYHQMARNKPTRLELHRLKMHKSNGCREMLLITELNKEELLLIGESLFSELHINAGKRNIYEVYADVLSSWGVMCPHPKSLLKVSHKSSYCSACGSHMRTNSEDRNT